MMDDLSSVINAAAQTYQAASGGDGAGAAKGALSTIGAAAGSDLAHDLGGGYATAIAGVANTAAGMIPAGAGGGYQGGSAAGGFKNPWEKLSKAAGLPPPAAKWPGVPAPPNAAGIPPSQPAGQAPSFFGAIKNTFMRAVRATGPDQILLAAARMTGLGITAEDLQIAAALMSGDPNAYAAAALAQSYPELAQRLRGALLTLRVASIRRQMRELRDQETREVAEFRASMAGGGGQHAACPHCQGGGQPWIGSPHPAFSTAMTFDA